MSEPMEETVVEGETTEPTGIQSGEKRPIENEGDNELVEPRLSKKARNGRELSRNLRRVAEIVLVMSTMTAVRGGKKPTDAEIELMAEARAKLVQICEELAPKDIVGREGISSVIEDLGLHGKAKDQKLGFRGPRLTIAEKLAQAKKKMEDSKKYIPPSAYGSHPTQTNFTSSVESRGAMPTVRMLPSDKSSHVPTSVGGTAAALPSGHVSVTGSASIQVQAQLPSNEVRAHIISSGFPISHQGRDSSSFLHGVERPLNGTYGSQMQVNSSVNHPLASTPTWSAQTQSALSAKGGPEHKLPNHSAVSVQGTADSSTLRSSSQAARDQSFRPSTSQTVTGNMAGLQPHLQSMNFLQGPSLLNNHNEIVKIIQKLLQPQLPDHPTWNPPSRDYMNKAVTCQTCQTTINEIDSVLICDACEKGFHLKCVQSPNQRAIPRGEWHCSRCLTISNGKPLPPKYGRVMRSNPPPKLSVNTSGTQPSEKRSGTIEQKAGAGQLKLVSNGGSDFQSPQPADYASNANESSGTKIPDVEEIHGNHFLPIRKDIDEKSTSVTYLNTPAKSLGLVCDSSSAELSSERSAQHIKISQSLKGEDGSSESKAEPPPEESQTVADNSSDPKHPDISQTVDQKMISNGPEKPYLTTSAHGTSNVKEGDHEILQATNVENFEASIINKEQSGTSSDDLHDVEWIGSPSVLTNGKAYYKSCCIDGVTYKVEEFALFHSSHGKLMPYMLQSMCHDYQDGLNWAVLRKCYFHEDLPKKVVHLCPSSAEYNEVYVSDGYICLMVGLIRSPCEILPAAKFKEECERRKQLGLGADNGTKPIFLCKWFYSEARNGFVPFTGTDFAVVPQFRKEGTDEKPTSATSLNTPAKSLGLVCDCSSAELSSERSAQHSKSSQSPKGEDGSSESKAEPPEESQTVPDNSSDPKPPDISPIVDQKIVSNGPEESHSTSVRGTSNVKKGDHEILQANNVENFEAIINREQSGTSSDDLHDVEWIGSPSVLTNGKAYYNSCRIDGVTYKVEEFALFHSSHGKLMPYRLQSMCHDYQDGSNWAVLKKCYFYEDLPKKVVHLHPSSPEYNEVYVSDGYICLMVGLIRSPCEILPAAKFKEECERRKQLGLGVDNGTKPIFLCKWFYSEARNEFVPFTVSY